MERAEAAESRLAGKVAKDPFTEHTMHVEKNARVAFQGERGAFSEEAAVKLLGEEITLVPRPTFEAAFSAIADRAADYILAPIENSLAGSVHRSFDLLVDSPLNILAEVIIPIAHNLIAAPGAKFEEIAVVESHPVALAQCEQFFSAHPRLKRIATEDTAGSVRDVVASGDPSRGAIAGRRAAEIYGGAILREHLEDNCENYTRFLLLSDSANSAADADKLSLVFQLDHRPRALYNALEPFARRNLNLMKIESRPVHGRPWQYRFYLDLQASRRDPEVAAALRELESLVVDLRILGSYVSAPRSDSTKS
jgi:prephenate dehydratase